MSKNKKDRIAKNAFTVQNIFKKGVTRNQIDFARDIIRDGKYNDYLDYIIEVVNKSPIGGACLNVKQDFITGQGFNYEELEDQKVNPKQTFLDIHKQVSQDLAFSHRFALRIYWGVNEGLEDKIKNIINNKKDARAPKRRLEKLKKLINEVKSKKLVIKGIDHIPVEQVRYHTPNRETGEVKSVIYNPFYNTSEDYGLIINGSETGATTQVSSRFEREYPLFDPDQVISDYLEHKNNTDKDYPFAQVLYYNEETPLNRIYSNPAYFERACDAMLTDRAIWQFHERNVNNNFFLGGILRMVGDKDEPIYEDWQDENGETQQRVVSTVGEDLEEQLRDSLSGAENAGSVIVLWGADADTKPDLQPFSTQTNDELFTKLIEYVTTTILIAFQVPPVLANIQTSGKLGDTRERMESIKIYNDNTHNFRTTLNQRYNDIFKYFDESKLNFRYDPEKQIEITEIQAYATMPESLFKELPRDVLLKHISKTFKVESLDDFLEKQESEPNLEQPPGMEVSNEETYTDYPEAASDNAQKALDWIDEYEEDINCNYTRVGLARANQLAKKEAISLDTVRRMAQFNRHRGNAEISEENKGTPWKDCGYLAWQLWGGTEGIDWAIRKLKQIENGI